MLVTLAIGSNSHFKYFVSIHVASISLGDIRKEEEDELNMIYVAATRAKKCLYMPPLMLHLLELANVSVFILHNYCMQCWLIWLLKLSKLIIHVIRWKNGLL